MAFQLLLQKMTGMERDLKSIVGLLQKVITQLEVGQTETEVPMASYEQLYPEMAEVATEAPAADTEAPPAQPRRWYRWFLKKGSP
jgi:hypothetical protein